jgi:hypothetical protein
MIPKLVYSGHTGQKQAPIWSGVHGRTSKKPARKKKDALFGFVRFRRRWRFEE